jgi:hypothetical protein
MGTTQGAKKEAKVSTAPVKRPILSKKNFAAI